MVPLGEEARTVSYHVPLEADTTITAGFVGREQRDWGG